MIKKYEVQVDFGDKGFTGTYNLINAMWVIRKYAAHATVKIISKG